MGTLFARTLPCQCCFDALLLARLQIECVTLDLFDDVLLQDLSLKALERVLQAFAVFYVNFSQRNHLGSACAGMLQGNSFSPDWSFLQF
jgi:hypothetical protein